MRVTVSERSRNHKKDVAWMLLQGMGRVEAAVGNAFFSLRPTRPRRLSLGCAAATFALRGAPGRGGEGD